MTACSSTVHSGVCINYSIESELFHNFFFKNLKWLLKIDISGGGGGGGLFPRPGCPFIIMKHEEASSSYKALQDKG